MLKTMKRVCKMLTKENVVELVRDYLEREGYEIISGNADLVAKKDQLVKVIVNGAVSDASRTSQVGKGYNKNQIKMNIALSVYEIMKLMDHETQFMIALPDNKIYSKLAKEVISGLKAFGIILLFVSEQGLVKKIS